MSRVCLMILMVLMDVIRLVIILLLIIALIILCAGTLGDCLQQASGPHRMYLLTCIDLD